jgi:hypothetical protein
MAPSTDVHRLARRLRLELCAPSATAIILAVTLAAGCGSEPPRGIWDGSFGTGTCANGAPGQFTCTPDPGSKPADCAGEEDGLEFVTLGDFTGDKATKWYVYIDRSGTGKISSFNQGWEANTAADPFPICGDAQSKALHLQGGPFFGWGGGFGTSMRDFVPSPLDPAYDCFLHPGNPLCVPSTDEFASVTVDVSKFEGVALWARRGPDSQGGLRVNVGDVNTDDDISYMMYRDTPARTRNCERVRECACTNHKACAAWATSPLTNPLLASWAATTTSSDSWTCALPGTYCEDPSAGIVPGYQPTGGTSTRCNSCDRTQCDEPYEAFQDQPDNQFSGRPCSTFTSRTGITTGYCFDPAKDPLPAESDQQCGDHWMRGIYLTNEWHLYLVPFTEMLQQGWAKRFGKMDVKHVTMVRLTWDGGYVDYWIGKVAFYRHKS